MRLNPQASAARVAEKLDDLSTPLEAVRATLRDQGRANRQLGGHDAVCRYALPFLRACDSNPLRAVELGVGQGDILRLIVDDARRQGKPIAALALDRNPHVLTCSRHWCAAYPEISFVGGDVTALPLQAGAFELVMLPTLLHHLAPDEAVALLQGAARLSRGLVVVSDLVRCRGAALLVPFFAPLYRMHPVTVHDLRISLRCAYTPSELSALAKEAGLRDWQVHQDPWLRMTLVYRGQSSP